MLATTTRADGSVEARSYDANGQMTALTDQTASGQWISHYDAAGNVLTEQNSAATVASATYGATRTPLPYGTMTYTADNRLATYNGQNVIHDSDGNMITGPLGGQLQGYQYDARNRLISAGGVSYAYNSENVRIGMTVNGVTTKYVVNPHANLSQVLMEKDELLY
ncbi:hypothetical protein HQN90_25980 [Paenibacillus alba]|uniref:hypothetical protein n=1 Tax=Paenibacillus alba TaxID=1197127 RepID=UPI001566588A|nr:hypothetical protein [Paenibacillus alba]NQX69587.1 hypothetical protein [Paenibacillus alba]